jgi:hypothetical protein
LGGFVCVVVFCFAFVFVFAVLGIHPSTLHMLDKYSTIELHSPAYLLFLSLARLFYNSSSNKHLLKTHSVPGTML